MADAFDDEYFAYLEQNIVEIFKLTEISTGTPFVSGCPTFKRPRTQIAPHRMAPPGGLPLEEFRMQPSSRTEEFEDNVVHFGLTDGRPGVSLESAFSGDGEWMQIQDGDHPAYHPDWGVAAKGHFRCQVCRGAHLQGSSGKYERQITAMRSTAGGESITRKTLARKIAIEIGSAIKKVEPQYYNGKKIKLEHLRLVEYRRKSKGSWEPVLQINESMMG
ncbi:uncharacterized protein BXZ73DRAFT_106092 [Epithele typhae]|uniref:uncharacterized protein n=1 Tax=Epithele typhae TaxID=378194 RepID=UPI0020085FA5|nr:uncharacterized protein BXZ73DRAFT_106092 [Epithele typhae]KAH9915810.1 hypothetical protein BXZ73DRAFT_106092 [Epithele typhae]